MSSIVLDQASIERLRNCDQVTVLQDSNGNVVGYFEPPHLHVYEQGEIPGFVKEAVKKPLADGEKISSAEVLRRLKDRS